MKTQSEPIVPPQREPAWRRPRPGFRPTVWLVTATCVWLALAARPAAAALSGSGSFGSEDINTIIPDGNVNGSSSIINVSGLQSSLSTVSINLNVSGGVNSDLYAYLTGPGGQNIVLLNRIGITGDNPLGNFGAGFNITIANGGTDIHGNTGNSFFTGTYGADRRDRNPVNFTYGSQNQSDLNSTFGNSNPNGNWTLFFSDGVFNDNTTHSTLVNWSLDVTAVPEPINVALGVFGGLFAAFTVGRRMGGKNRRQLHSLIPRLPA